MKSLTVVFMLLMLALPMAAQEKADSVFTFRFYMGRNEFYSPGLNNGKELARLYRCVDQNKDLIRSKKMMVYVDGHSNSPKKTAAQNRYLAKIRSNRVKSELITLKGLKEHNFITHNHVDEGNFVTVRLYVPNERVAEIEKEPDVPEPPHAPVENEDVPVVEAVETVDDAQPVENDSVTNVESKDLTETAYEVSAYEVVTDSIVNPSRVREDSPFALKTNLLDYAILMPNLELEWKCAPRWSVALEGQMAWYSNGKYSPHKVYRIATVIPEARYWVIERSRWKGMYVGVFGGGGLYDLSTGRANRHGHKGEGWFGGVSAGYMWPISQHLSLDAGLGLGYARIRDRVYSPLDGHFLYQYTKYINYFGPLRLKLSLVWRIPR